jgi:hypothetical protein
MMRLRTLALVAVAGPIAAGMAPAQAGLDGATVQTATFLEVTFTPPTSPPQAPALPAVQDCSVIDCSVPNYPLFPGDTAGQNFPAPTAPVDYLQDNLTGTTISIEDNKITITNDQPGAICPAAGCTPGDFGGYVFTFTGAPDITNVTETNTGNFVPVPIDPGLPNGWTWTNNTITLNVLGDSPDLNATLTLDITTAGSGPPTIPEPSTWAMMLLGFAGLGFAGYRRSREAARAA